MKNKIHLLSIFLLLILTVIYSTLKGQTTNTSFALIVDNKFYASLETEIQRLADDIENDLSTKTIIEVVDVNQTTTKAIREKLQCLYKNNGLIGVILIGDIPTAFIGDFYTNLPFPTDVIYEDLDDECWADPDSNGIYNIAIDRNNNGNYNNVLLDGRAEHNREIYSGRLKPPWAISIQERIELLRSYLERNHQYRTGNLIYKRGMVYSETIRRGLDDYETTYNRALNMMDNSWLFDRAKRDTLVFIWSDDLMEHSKQWLSAVHDSYEYGFIWVHGTKDYHFFGNDILLTGADYRDMPPNTLFIDLNSCSNGLFTYLNYLAGWILFSGQALAVKGFTIDIMTVGSPNSDPVLNLLSLGLKLGEIKLTETVGTGASSLIFFGDPTLGLRKRINGLNITIDKDTVILPDEEFTEGLHDAYYWFKGSEFIITNNGNENVKVYYKDGCPATLDGKLPNGDSYNPRFFVKNLPDSILPGQSKSFPIQFYIGGKLFEGTYRSKFCIYTNSSTSPYFWISVEKKLTSIPLPIALISFKAVSINNSIKLQWETSTEINNYGFDIERKAETPTGNKTDWLKIGFVKGSGNSNSSKEYSFVDDDLSNLGKYYYRLKQIDNNGQYKYSNEIMVDLIKPYTYSLNQNYPNPFNPTTTINFSVAKTSLVTIKVYDILGNEVRTLVNEEKPAGDYCIRFEAIRNHLSSGVYFYRMQAASFFETKKLILMK